MENVLIEIINDEKLGKIAHMLDEENKNIFCRVIESDLGTLYEEITEIEETELLNRLNYYEELYNLEESIESSN